MALFTQPPSYAGATSAAPFVSGIRNIGSFLTQRPYMQAMAQQRGAMANYYGARANEQAMAGQEAAARANLLNEQTRGEKQKNDAAASDDDNLRQFGQLTRAFVAAQNAYRANPTPENQTALDNATSDMSGGAATLREMKVGDLATAIGRLRAQGELAAQNPDFQRAGGLQGNAASVANENTRAATEAAKPVIIPTGGTMATPAGNVLATGGVTLSPGQDRFAPQGQPAAGVQPVGMGSRLMAQGQPAAPKSSAADAVRANLVSKLTQTKDPDATNKLAQFDSFVAGQKPTGAPAAQPGAASGAALPGLTGQFTLTGQGVGVPVAHVQWLQQAAAAGTLTPTNVASFEQAYGPGSAAQFLKGVQPPGTALPAQTPPQAAPQNAPQPQPQQGAQ